MKLHEIMDDKECSTWEDVMWIQTALCCHFNVFLMALRKRTE
jgi:hypothetical protein